MSTILSQVHIASIQNSLPTDNSCLICDRTIEEVGGQKLIATRLRGTRLTTEFAHGKHKNFCKQVQLFDDSQLAIDFWGEKNFMTEAVIQKALKSYRYWSQPWFCQVCGSRQCSDCGAPIIVLAYGDFAFEDGRKGYYAKGPNLGVSPPCKNRNCKNYHKRAEDY
ncbi:MAG: hypothetical protein IMF09_08565 [Proteobacteria bacterium]|nr:hypothetical protein [Pseudomonadota bacterium]